MINVVGEVFDVLNAGISVARGNYADATLSMAAAIPIVGAAGDAGKIAHKAAKAISKSPISRSASKTGLKNADDVIHVTPDGVALPKGTKHKIPDHMWKIHMGGLEAMVK